MLLTLRNWIEILQLAKLINDQHLVDGSQLFEIQIRMKICWKTPQRSNHIHNGGFSPCLGFVT